MTRQRLFTVGMAFAVATLPMSGLAAAQERTSNGNTTGSAVPRSDSGGGSAVPRSDGGGSTGGSVGGGASSGDTSSGSVSNIANNGWTAPSSPTPASAMGSYQPPTRYSEQSRTRSDGATTSGTATPRSGGGASAPRGDSSASSGSSSSGRSASSSGSNDSAPARRAVPAYSRPRGDRPVTGEAVERGTVPPAGGGGGGIHYPYYPYYPWGFWGPGYGFGLGYLFYDPFYGGYGYGYGDPGYFGGGGGGGYSSGQSSSSDTGAVRLKINPKQAQIFIDGYYVGIVDSYDGAFQKLSLDGGGHKVELKADGYEPLQFDVLVTPGETATYKGEMKRIQ